MSSLKASTETSNTLRCVHLKNIFFWFLRLTDQWMQFVLLISSPFVNGNPVSRELSLIYFQQVFNQVEYLRRGHFDWKTLFWSLHQTTDSSKVSKKRNWKPWFFLNILMFLGKYRSNLFHQSVSQNQYLFGEYLIKKHSFWFWNLIILKFQIVLLILCLPEV